MFEINDCEKIINCPWCGSENQKQWGDIVRGFKSVICENCELIFVVNRLNEKGRSKYLGNYIFDVHQADPALNVKREDMYKIELDFICRYIKSNAKVLDVGCIGGYFLEQFKKYGFECFGIEVDPMATSVASKKHIVWRGELPDLTIDQMFDLIIFRGVLQYLPFPKLYLEKALSLLNPDGLIFITSTPNSDSYCCRLFKEQWNSHEPEGHIMHFHKKHFDEYFGKQDMIKVGEYYFYEETPYANIEEDVSTVSKAIDMNKLGKKITFRSPAFWMNMMSLVYKKRNDN